MIVVKFGGSVLEAALADARFFEAFQEVPALVLVHGGGPEINQLAEQIKVETAFVDGQRVTSPELMKVVEMALSGSLNPRIVRALRSQGLDAFGLSGADGGLLSCELEDQGKLGLVGQVRSVRAELLEKLLDQGLLPVVSPCATLKEGQACNVNADMAACAVAASLRASQLLFLTDQDGLLDESGKVVSQLNASQLRRMRESPHVHGGMRIKSRSILEYLNACPFGRVQMVNGLHAPTLRAALKGESVGTVIEA